MSSASRGTPDTPYTGMPAFRKYRPSVAPVSMLGTTAAPGHMAAVMLSTGSSTSGTSGDAGDGTGSALTLTSAATAATR